MPKRNTQKCSLDFCDNMNHTREYCSTHYSQIYVYKIQPRPILKNTPCINPSCSKNSRGDTLCSNCNNRRWRYGLSVEEFLELPVACAVCGTSDSKMCIDHDHVTGKVRGRLCNECNLMIGWSGDSPQKLIDAAKYLSSHLESSDVVN